MKPTNLNHESCDPISSNCIIWQGPDIPCIKLCKGDSISVVVYKMAMELCTIIDILDISKYDLTCFEIQGCAPEDFKAFIKFLIERICALENIDPAQTPSSNGCPDCTVNIASCFYYQNPQGDVMTTMQLLDYVTAIGNRICQMVTQIQTINQTLAQQESRITALEQAQNQQQQNVEMVTPQYLLPRTLVPVGTLALETEKQFSLLRNATGTPDTIYQNILKQAAGLTESRQLAGNGTMGSIPGWTPTVLNLAQSHGNIWLAIADIRAAILNIQANCCPSLCSDVDINMSAVMVDPNTVSIFFNGVLPAGFVECNGAGTPVTITDSAGGSVTIYVPILMNFNQPTGYTIDLTATPVNGADDLNFTARVCLRQTTSSSECNFELEYFLNNIAACPTLELNSTESTIDYQFTHLGGAVTFKIQLFDGTGSTMLQEHTTAITGPEVVSGTFSSLNTATDYRVRVTMTFSEADPTICPFVAVSTLAPPCLPPRSVTAILNT